MKNKGIAALVMFAVIPFATACSKTETESSPSPLKKCQEAVSDFTKYPGSAQWGDVLLDEEDLGTHHIIGEADFNNDAGNPVRARYYCDIDIASGEWKYGPFLEPKDPVHGKYEEGKWGGYLSPMLEKYGDNMSLNETPTGQ